MVYIVGSNINLTQSYDLVTTEKVKFAENLTFCLTLKPYNVEAKTHCGIS